jgi:hypothetical protein
MTIDEVAEMLGVQPGLLQPRLHPVLRNGAFGGFLDMWRELLARHPEAATA